MMKKILFVLSIALAFSTSSVYAFELAGGYTGPVEIKLKDWEQFVPGFPGPTGTGLADGVTDLYGIMRLTSIETPGGTTLWSQSPGSTEFITGVFYGLDLESATATLPSDGRFTSGALSGGTAAILNLYLDTTAPTAPNGVPSTGINSYDPTVPNAGNPPIPDSYTDGGNLFLSLLFVPGIVPLANEVAGALPTVLQSSSTALTSPFSGTGFGYFDVIGGTFASLFDTNGFNTDPTGYNHPADIFFRSDITAPGEFGFNTKSDDPARANVGVIPEPSTFLLLGAGLLGAVLIRRKKSQG